MKYKNGIKIASVRSVLGKIIICKKEAATLGKDEPTRKYKVCQFFYYLSIPVMPEVSHSFVSPTLYFVTKRNEVSCSTFLSTYFC